MKYSAIRSNLKEYVPQLNLKQRNAYDDIVASIMQEHGYMFFQGHLQKLVRFLSTTLWQLNFN